MNLFVIHKDIAASVDHLVLANPEIIFVLKYCMSWKKAVCLSEIVGDVRRPEKFVLSLQQDGTKHTYKAKGMLAKVFQHEIDHLRGRLIIVQFES